MMMSTRPMLNVKTALICLAVSITWGCLRYIDEDVPTPECMSGERRCIGDEREECARGEWGPLPCPSSQTCVERREGGVCVDQAGGCEETGSCHPGITWVRIPGGSFQMGSTEHPTQQPIRTVTLSDFEMSQMEVTVRDYRACVEAGACSEPRTPPPLDRICTWSSSPESKENHPINCVDWGQARTFAKWVGADLPTEAEWEYAARGGQPFEYAGSDNPDEVAWYILNSDDGTRPVGTKRANGYGLYDMSGNVSEWTLDEYRDTYNGAPSDGHQPVGSIPTCSAVCDNGAARRVFRGGSWNLNAFYLRVALRGGRSPYPNGDLGLRLRRTLP